MGNKCYNHFSFSSFSTSFPALSPVYFWRWSLVPFLSLSLSHSLTLFSHSLSFLWDGWGLGVWGFGFAWACVGVWCWVGFGQTQNKPTNQPNPNHGAAVLRTLSLNFAVWFLDEV
eukprot:TRINITY_DN5029_c1_g1_i2.p1 TRINITY_DN5029_c1_g1~~TRINITY_DN5029_c1_g1_i2.p1  ORF type:complete len:115 (-),score=2.16 TRINITY_DN5029_c1_g1_i2:15-359(-)